MHKSTLISAITILPDRQREDLGDLSELKASMNSIGLLNAIIIDEDSNLIAGERRLTAARELGWTHIPTQQLSDLDPLTREQIELDENIRRLDLSWQERCKAIARYHALCRESEGEAWTVTATAEKLNLSQPFVSTNISIAREIATGNRLVAEAPTYSTARGIVERKTARKDADEKEELVALITGKPPVPAEATDDDEIPFPSPRPSFEDSVGAHPFENGDFNLWAAAYSGPKFNFIHCDFPYGINAGQHNQGAAKSFGGYADGEDVYWELLATLEAAMDNVVAESAHLMFWFSMVHYQPTLEILTNMGWRVNPWPLAWFKMDNKGILPDPSRGPRQVYEVAFMASRGDRLIVRAKSNLTAHPNTKEWHMSEKPKAMLSHFFEMFVDENTRMLDPTCGSGNSVIAAMNMGGAAIGIERDLEFYENALRNWKANKEKQNEQQII